MIHQAKLKKEKEMCEYQGIFFSKQHSFIKMTAVQATEAALEFGYVKSFTTSVNNGFGHTTDPDKQAPLYIEFYNKDDEKVFHYDCLKKTGVLVEPPIKTHPRYLMNKAV